MTRCEENDFYIRYCCCCYEDARVKKKLCTNFLKNFYKTLNKFLNNLKRKKRRRTNKNHNNHDVDKRIAPTNLSSLLFFPRRKTRGEEVPPRVFAGECFASKTSPIFTV